MPDQPKSNSLDFARKVLETEAQAILGLVPHLDGHFTRALDLLEGCSGRVIVTGMGKSGIIGRKLSATLSSIGTPALFLHAAEAVHGDLGVLRPNDVVIALSYSGETEVIRLITAIRRLGAKLIALTGNRESTLGQAADETLVCAVAEEACPMNLVPTASTTAMLALGDALAMALSERKAVSTDQFASLHPGGQIGKRLLRVSTLMHGGETIPRVSPDTRMSEVLKEISAKKFGMACVVDQGGQLQGVITDGDVRRRVGAGGNILSERAADVMTRTPVTIPPEMLAVEALRIMEQRHITSLVVVGTANTVEGLVHLHDLWRTQMF